MLRNKKFVRTLAIVLVVLLAGGVVVSALLSAFAVAEESPARNQCTLTMEYLEEQQALRIEQRLVYYNRTPDRLDRVVFYAAPNMFRREQSLMYENDGLEDVFFAGYAPGGIDLRSVRVNGAVADYGFQGEAELYLRVACDLQPGESAEFAFEYDLLMLTCGAFIGVGETDVRLGAFCLTPGVYSAAEHEFVLKKPLPYTRWLHTDAMDYAAALTLPETYELADTGRVEAVDDLNGAKTWHVRAENARDFALCFGKRYRVAEVFAASGVRVRVFSGRRDAAKTARMAVRAVEHCEAWFSSCPVSELDIAESDYPPGTLNYPGLILVSSRLMDDASALETRLRFCIAQQYFGLSAYVEPSADAWLSDSVCEYIGYLMLEADRGEEAFLNAINRDWVSALQLTIPGGLTVTSDASLFDGRSYDVVVLKRGAVVLHELRQAMGREALLTGLANFYQMGQDGRTLTEMDLVHCLNAVDGGDWEDFLTDWVFNVGEYVEQSIDWLS